MEVQDFVERLVNEIKARNAFGKVLGKVRENRLRWDIAAREIIGSLVEELFRTCFPEIKLEESVKVEGKGVIRKPKPIFGSYGQYPDIRIEKPWKLAIELDNSGRRNAGSRYKMALVKAALNVLSKDWDYCVVLFHNYSGKKLEPYLSGKTEQDILKFYEEKLKTKIYLFED